MFGLQVTEASCAKISNLSRIWVPFGITARLRPGHSGPSRGEEHHAGNRPVVPELSEKNTEVMLKNGPLSSGGYKKIGAEGLRDQEPIATAHVSSRV